MGKGKVILPDWWSDVTQETPEKYTKKVQYGGHKFTTIDAMYQVMTATEIFGLYGEAWGVRNLKYGYVRENSDDAGRLMFVTLDAEFFYPNQSTFDNPEGQSSFEISSEIRAFDSKGNLVTDLRKKLLTDVTTKALSKIGFNADVFLGFHDDNKYISSMSKEDDDIIRKALPPQTAKHMRELIDSQKVTLKSLNQIEDRLAKHKDTPSSIELKQLINDKKAILQS